jgi:hypothetical protein
MSALAAYPTPCKRLRERYIDPSQRQGAADSCPKHRQQPAVAA